MARRRKRPQFAWERALGVLLVVNLVTGLYASRLTSLIKIRVEGALPQDKPRIKAILERTHSKPALQLDRQTTESAIMEKSEVESAEMTRNIFGRARVVVRYRDPVAKIVGSKMAISEGGAVFQTDKDLDDLPTFAMPSFAMKPIAGIVGPWQFRSVGALAKGIRGIGGPETVQIQITEDGGLCLNIGSKFAVDLGLPERLDAKVDFLKKRIEDHPEILTSGKTLVLVSLDRPSEREGVGRNRK
jgi:hypothetical protein